MTHHAYVYAGDREAGIAAARVHAAKELALEGTDNPDIAVFAYGLFSVSDARKVGQFASQSPVAGEKKLIVIATGRIFHEAQNALLKLFEEPTEGTTLVLVIPAEGMLLPTLRSRLMALPEDGRLAKSTISGIAEEFIAAGKAEREKLVAKLIARSKSDKDEEKQAARADAISIIEALTRAAYDARKNAKGDTSELDMLLSDLDRFTPILHERSPALKLIFEHLLIVVPERL